ncbi:MAG: restriction endonuclease subunit S [Bifidobacterium tibiigranuli]|uniref:restriction endonuclease subunit S n=1 Tax=Bifidobacterium tibiigranuli TaxID=2172043 RepID=UPI0026E95104|nr:restriction endonuclease subunit S [Bifidobacterium tibiigranuli]MCI1672649.1 restriction endonuclease subunit S [Bifidobacterium tibiigranuli]MCI1712346.1 restriction endonuclease subunit S [Bifidobacterium tibiigranuli]MCI1833344.1 restriction endonuclease subunit S [Bifidobacterium tibiigranuli]
MYAAERVTGNIPYITAGSKNNGIGYFVGNLNITLDEGYVAFNRNGAIGQAFYHDYQSLLGNDCRKIHISAADNDEYVGLFIALAITKQKNCFSYSRKLGTQRAKQMKIMLPSVDGKTPNYEFMRQYVSSLMHHQYEVLSSFFDDRQNAQDNHYGCGSLPAVDNEV